MNPLDPPGQERKLILKIIRLFVLGEPTTGCVERSGASLLDIELQLLRRWPQA